jgi:hypothetical protein
MKQGTKANFTGKNLETFIEHILQDKGYTYIESRSFKVTCCLEQPIYSRQFTVGNGIYDTPITCDFILHDPIKYPNCLVIESKWQESSGSVDEKFPYIVWNIEKLGYPTIIVLDGGGYKPGAEKWLRNQVGKHLLYVFNMSEFQRWSNSDAL